MLDWEPRLDWALWNKAVQNRHQRRRADDPPSIVACTALIYVCIHTHILYTHMIHIHMINEGAFRADWDHVRLFLEGLTPVPAELSQLLISNCFQLSRHRRLSPGTCTTSLLPLEEADSSFSCNRNISAQYDMDYKNPFSQKDKKRRGRGIWHVTLFHYITFNQKVKEIFWILFWEPDVSGFVYFLILKMFKESQHCIISICNYRIAKRFFYENRPFLSKQLFK